MNPHTGHLVALEGGEAAPEGYEKIRSRLMQSFAEKALNGQPETTVNLKAKTPLAQWAKKKRKAKIAAKARRINRGRK